MKPRRRRVDVTARTYSSNLFFGFGGIMVAFRRRSYDSFGKGQGRATYAVSLGTWSTWKGCNTRSDVFLSSSENGTRPAPSPFAPHPWLPWLPPPALPLPLLLSSSSSGSLVQLLTPRADSESLFASSTWPVSSPDSFSITVSRSGSGNGFLSCPQKSAEMYSCHAGGRVLDPKGRSS